MNTYGIALQYTNRTNHTKFLQFESDDVARKKVIALVTHTPNIKFCTIIMADVWVVDIYRNASGDVVVHDDRFSPFFNPDEYFTNSFNFAPA